jgi:hypothetical protein
MTVAKALLDIAEACASVPILLFQQYYHQLFPLRDRLPVPH